MGMVERDMKMVNAHCLIPCFNRPGFRVAAAKEQSDSKRGFLLNSISTNTELRGGEGIGFINKSSYAASVPGTFDALESLELFGILGTYGDEEGCTQLLREEPSTSKPDLDTLIMKTGSESIEATLRRRRILFAGFVARMGNTRLPKCAMFVELVGGVGCVAGQEKNWMGCFPDDLRAFGINADEWTI